MAHYIDRGTYYELVDPPGSERWKQERKYRVTATSMAAVARKDPFMTYDECIENICNPKEIPVNEDMQRGMTYEPVALEMYCQKYGAVIRRPSFCVPKNLPLTGATPDAIVLNSDRKDSDLIVEIKCPRKFTGLIYDKYMYQMMYQMYVTKATRCDYVQYVNNEIQVMRVMWDDVRWELFYPELLGVVEEVKTRQPVITSAIIQGMNNL